MNLGNEIYNLLLLGGGTVVILFILLLSLFLLFKSKKNKDVLLNKEFVDFLISKIDKIERGLNDVKANLTRWQEFAEIEFKEIEKSINDNKEYSSSNRESFTDKNSIPSQSSSDKTKGEKRYLNSSESLKTNEGVKSDFDTVDLFEDSKKKSSDEKLNNINPVSSSSSDDENETILFENAKSSSFKKNSIIQDSNLHKKATVSSGLSKTRESFFSKIKGIFSDKSELDREAFDELEAILFSTDMGTALTSKLMEELKAESVKGVRITETELLAKVKDKVKEILLLNNQSGIDEFNLKNAKPYVIMVVGVNGAGKTTTIAKLANTFKSQDKRVLIAAADTFRAAATEQLESWGKMLNIPVVSGEEGAKPGTVAFDAMQKATKENYDILLIDTAGRLQSQANLMQELSGVSNLIKRLNPQAPHEVILVLDGTTGQNALLQAEKFKEVVPVTSVAITKLDGTPKGGIVVAIKSEFGIPIRFIGVGEGKDDLKVFDPNEFVEALFDVN